MEKGETIALIRRGDFTLLPSLLSLLKICAAPIKGLVGAG